MSELTLHNLLPKGQSIVPSKSQTYVGIDFGTSTTVVSYIDVGNNGIITTIPLFIKQELPSGGSVSDYKVPTCIAYSSKFNELYIGQGAYESGFDTRLEQGKNVWFEFKTLLGEDVGPRYAQSILNGKDGKPNLETALDATTIFLKYIREQVEKELATRHLSGEIRWAVSVPASFEANQRKDLLSALDKAGIKSIGEALLIDEPNAAFLSFVEQSKRPDSKINPLPIPDGKPISLLVFDFGAGTCDISILQIGQDDRSGVISKNVAISHYTEIGGKDIDKGIADMLIGLLNPMEAETPLIKDIPGRTKERLQHQLLRIAEELKITLCKNVYFIKKSNAKVDFENTSSILGVSPEPKDFKGRKYILPSVKLTYNMFGKIMEEFTSQETNKSIFKPIDSALKSAGLKPLEIDYLLLVGGSAKNPWIQDALTKYFNEAEVLITDDIQSLVSQGTALHSYFLNGLGHKLIKPITGPTIQLRMANGQLLTLVPSGTEIPFEGMEINNLYPQSEGQEIIELPVCLSSESQILQVLKIEPQSKSGFSLTDRISLAIKITADKTLHIAAKVSTGEVVVSQLNPYSSIAMSTRQRVAAEGRKRFNRMVRQNGGVRTAQALINLAEALSRAEERLESAEIMEESYEIDPNSVEINNIGVAWSNAGNSIKADKYYLLAFEKGSVYAGVNLAVTKRWSNPEMYRELLNKAFEMNPFDSWVLYNYGQMLKDDGNPDWKQHWNTTLKICMSRLTDKSLKKDDTERAINIAKALEKNDELTKLKHYKSFLPDDDQFFIEDYTVTNTPKLNNNPSKQLIL